MKRKSEMTARQRKLLGFIYHGACFLIDLYEQFKTKLTYSLLWKDVEALSSLGYVHVLKNEELDGRVSFSTTSLGDIIASPVTI